MEKMRDFPGGPVVKTLYFQCRGYRFHYGWGTKILHVAWLENKREMKKMRSDLESTTDHQGSSYA